MAEAGIDADGGEIALDGRVMEMLSEHTLEGWFEGYVLTGRHGFFSTYEAFVHVIDSHVQPARQVAGEVQATTWAGGAGAVDQPADHVAGMAAGSQRLLAPGPGFLDVVTNKSPEVTRIYLPPDANCLLSVTDHCLRSRDYVNVIVADKQDHLAYLDMEAAVKHCTKGIGIWDWLSTDVGVSRML